MMRVDRLPGGGWRERACGGGGGASSAQGRLKGVGHRARAERTQNISYMLVTLEVSQLEMSALKFPWL